MYNSLKPWLNVAYQYKPFIRRNGAGTKIFGDAVDSKCYPVNEVRLITNLSGAEVVSSTHLYVDGSEAIKVTDSVVFEGNELPIQRISTFYTNGKPDIKVVYL